MEFLNLTLGQFLITFGAISAFSVALYLLDRTRRRQVVSTLRFWVTPGQPAPVSRNRKVNQPLSLLLQLLGMLLLLLAIAEFQFGGTLNKRRDHVLVLDTSAWMGATLPGQTKNTLMDVVRANAIGWLRAVPPTDRVLVVRADGLATPATSWETDRRKVARAILESQPGATALNLSQNLEFARELQRQSGTAPGQPVGEIVYSGPGRISSRESAAMNLPAIPAFRVLNAEDDIPNLGLRSVGARRSESDPGTWDILVRVRNYGKTARLASVTLNFGKAPVGMHPVELPAGGEKETVFKVRTRAAGILEARLYPKDGFGADNYAALELPEQRVLHVIAYTDQPEQMRPALASDPRVNAEFKPKSQYTPANDGLLILDRFHPAQRPHGNVLWIDPPNDQPPVPIRQRVDHPEGLRWVPDQPLTEGLRARNTQIEATSVFQPDSKALRVAEIDKGPVVVASLGDDGKSRIVVIGFNPFAGSMRYELTTPLLIGNILRWMEPGVFRDVDVATQSTGAVSSPIATTTDRNSVQVLTDNGTVLPFNIRDRAVQFFAGEQERVRVIAGNTESVFSLTLPEMWDTKWTPPSTARKGIPAWTDNFTRRYILWPWLALLGAGLLVAEWAIYGNLAITRKLHVLKSGLGRAA
jgi:hypothetical protein